MADMNISKFTVC